MDLEVFAMKKALRIGCVLVMLSAANLYAQRAVESFNRGVALCPGRAG